MWIRTCQECGHKQESKPPAEYKGDSWTEVKCKKCKSIGLNYGSETENNSLTPQPKPICYVECIETVDEGIGKMRTKEQVEEELSRLQLLLPTLRIGGYLKDQCKGRIDALKWVLEQNYC